MAAAGKAAAGRPKMGEEKLIIRSEKVRLFDILSMMILRRPITSYAFVDVGDETARDIGITPGDIFVKLTEIIQKVLASIYTPAKWLGIVVEFLLNFVALNGGLLGILWNIVRCYPYGVTLGSALGPPFAGGTSGCHGFWMHTAPDGH